MKLYDLYLENAVKNVWRRLDEELGEGDESQLGTVLGITDDILTTKFGIGPKEQKYFIAGSSHIYLYPELVTQFKFEKNPGDMDIVIPYEEIWVNAINEGKKGTDKGLKDGEYEYDKENGYIYRPSKDIEIFSKWKPEIVDPGKFKDKNVRNEKEIIKESKLVGNHYYMPIEDIVDYKYILERPKEQQIAILLNQHIKQHGDVPITRKDIFTFLSNFFGKEGGLGG